jgi:hypothetical protein
VSSASASSGRPGNRPLAVIVGIIGILAVIVGVLYFALTSLPGFLTLGSHVHGAGHHLLRGAVALIVGIVLLIVAWRTSKSKTAPAQH